MIPKGSPKIFCIGFFGVFVEPFIGAYFIHPLHQLHYLGMLMLIGPIALTLMFHYQLVYVLGTYGNARSNKHSPNPGLGLDPCPLWQARLYGCNDYKQNLGCLNHVIHPSWTTLVPCWLLPILYSMRYPNTLRLIAISSGNI